MAVEWVAVGGFDDEERRRAEMLRLGILNYVGGQARVRDALDRAITVRRGVPVLGEKGTGKTVAVDLAVRAFTHQELEARRRDHKYLLRRVVVVPTLRAKKYRDALLMIGLAVSGTVPPERVQGRRRSDDELRHEILARCHTLRIVALVINEAEYLASEALDVLRDLMANSEEGDGSRYAADGIGASGIGMLLVGTPSVSKRLRRIDEFNQRWLSPVEILGATPEEVAKIYRDWLPGLDRHAREIGDAAWTAFTTQHVGKRPVALRLLDTHVRLYFRRLMRKALAEQREIPTRESAGFDEQLFLLTLRESREGGAGA